jgi:ubiquinone/menaquinone biosynthesis C-methylase UbiE|tara:strand:+ start:126 stop:323 length:198 start_codon:yes stop_codon:yes gene_type:complete
MPTRQAKNAYVGIDKEEAKNVMGAEVIGVDLSEEMIRLAREYYPDTKFRRSDAYRLPFQNSSAFS